MATVNRGILDGFFGKVGTVVGSFWKGIPVMRAYVRRVRDRKNESQQLVRARFITLGELSSAFLAALRLGFLNEAARNRVTESNIFVKKNWEAVQAATPDSVSIDYTALVVAKGPLHGVQFSAPQFDNPQQVSVVFDPNDELPMVDDNDDIYVFVYCPDSKSGVLGAPVKRSVGRATVDVPSYWSGMKVHAWGFAVGGGIDNAGAISDSAYLGSGNIN
ncbi:MAG: hypothetical protein J5677_04220 [Bacteroidales bacterium]|nr:hypothetical protein [Bacteroidales bacterium]